MEHLLFRRSPPKSRPMVKNTEPQHTEGRSRRNQQQVCDRAGFDRKVRASGSDMVL